MSALETVAAAVAFLSDAPTSGRALGAEAARGVDLGGLRGVEERPGVAVDIAAVDSAVCSAAPFPILSGRLGHFSLLNGCVFHSKKTDKRVMSPPT